VGEKTRCQVCDDLGGLTFEAAQGNQLEKARRDRRNLCRGSMGWRMGVRAEREGKGRGCGVVKTFGGTVGKRRAGFGDPVLGWIK